MEKLGLESVEELEVALDAMEGIADDGGELDPTNISREARLREAYMDWCKEYGKENDESRFKTFSSNFLSMEQYANENGKTMQLNKYADCTEEEYIALTSGNTNSAPVEEETAEEVIVEEAPVVDAATEAKAKEEAEKAAEEAKAKKEADDKAAAEAKAKKEADAKAAAEAKAKKEAEDAEAEAGEYSHILFFFPNIVPSSFLNCLCFSCHKM